MRTAPRLTVFAFIAMAILPSHADTYTYSYTGKPEIGNVLGSPLVPGEILTVSFTLSSPFGDNIVAQTIPTPSDYVIKDGPITLTAQSASATFLQFWTDASGTITMWNADAYQGTYGQTNFISMGTYNNPFHTIDEVVLGTGVQTTNFNNPGTWSVSVNATPAVPEPTSFILLATGTVGFLTTVRHRFS